MLSEIRRKPQVRSKRRSALGRALFVASLVAVAGCAATGGPGLGALGMALGLLLSLSGCSQSHGSSTDADGDGYPAPADCNDHDPAGLGDGGVYAGDASVEAGVSGGSGGSGGSAGSGI